MSTQSPLPQNDPMLIAFQKLKKTPEYQNAVKWTIKAENESQADRGRRLKANLCTKYRKVGFCAKKNTTAG